MANIEQNIGTPPLKPRAISTFGGSVDGKKVLGRQEELQAEVDSFATIHHATGVRKLEAAQEFVAAKGQKAFTIEQAKDMGLAPDEARTAADELEVDRKGRADQKATDDLKKATTRWAGVREVHASVTSYMNQMAVNGGPIELNRPKSKLGKSGTLADIVQEQRAKQTGLRQDRKSIKTARWLRL